MSSFVMCKTFCNFLLTRFAGRAFALRVEPACGRLAPFGHQSLSGGECELLGWGRIAVTSQGTMPFSQSRTALRTLRALRLRLKPFHP